MNQKDFIENIIQAIEQELEHSSSTCYICKNGEKIDTDVGYVEEWFEKYKQVLRQRFYQ